jgi:hypothetical protein
MLHRVVDPLGLLRILRARLADGGQVLLETHGAPDADPPQPVIEVFGPGQVYGGDDYVWWGFTPAGLDRLAVCAGFTGLTLADAPMID